MKTEEKKKLRNISLIILVLIIGIIIGKSNINLFTNTQAQEENGIERATSSRHGYGMYLNFEYEIITNSYGYFVVVKDRDNGTLTTAGLN